MDEPLAFLNGQSIPFSQAAIPVYDKGIVMGATVSEMTRTYRRRLFRLDDHLDRLYASLGCVGIDLGISKPDMARISSDLCLNNARLAPEKAELGLIHFVTAGKVGLYAGRLLSSEENRPTVCVHTFPLDFRYYADAMREGNHVVIPSTRHVPTESVPASIKHRSRLHWHLAEREAHLVDSKATPILLDSRGYLTECTAANFFMVRDNAVLTPTTRNILGGVSRKVVMEIARELRLAVSEQDLAPGDVSHASEAILSSTPFGICPVTRFNGQSVGDGHPGPVWTALAAAWSRQVGVDIVEQVIRDGWRSKTG